jgi:hypothetical protein
MALLVDIANAIVDSASLRGAVGGANVSVNLDRIYALTLLFHSFITPSGLFLTLIYTPFAPPNAISGQFIPTDHCAPSDGRWNPRSAVGHVFLQGSILWYTGE